MVWQGLVELSLHQQAESGLKDILSPLNARSATLLATQMHRDSLEGHSQPGSTPLRPRKLRLDYVVDDIEARGSICLLSRYWRVYPQKVGEILESLDQSSPIRTRDVVGRIYSVQDLGQEIKYSIHALYQI